MKLEQFYATLQETVHGQEYLTLIKQARARKDLVPGEDHHIHPRSLGGALRAPSNIVRLTYYEHILAHYHLTLAFPRNSKLFCAFKCMSQMHFRFVNEVEKVKLEQLEGWARLREKQHNRGQVMITDGYRDRFVSKDELESLEPGWYIGMSETARSQRYGNDHHKGKVVGEEGRNNLSKSHAGKRWVSNPETLESTSVTPEEAEQMVTKEGWVYGRLNYPKRLVESRQRAERFISDLECQKSFKIYTSETEDWLAAGKGRFVLGRIYWGKDKLLQERQELSRYLQ